MGQQNDVYIIEEEDLLDSVRRLEKAATRAGGDTLRAVQTTPRRRKGDRDLRPGGRFSAPISSTFSLLICGAGQAMNGQWRLGLLLFLTEVLAACGHWCLFQSWSFFRDMAHMFAISEEELFLGVAALDFLLVFFLLYNVAQAYHQGEARSGGFDGLHSGWLAGLASAIVPGWGQLLNAQVGKGLFFLFCILGEVYVISLVVLTSYFHLFPELGVERLMQTRGDVVQLSLFFVTTVVWTLSIYDGYLIGRYAGDSGR